MSNATIVTFLISPQSSEFLFCSLILECTVIILAISHKGNTGNRQLNAFILFISSIQHLQDVLDSEEKQE